MKRIKAFLIILLLGMVAVLYNVLWRIDASLVPIPLSVVPEMGKDFPQERPLLALVYYAAGEEVFFRNQNALVFSAAKIGFDRIYNFRQGQLEKEWVQKNQLILQQPRGAGYWLWKPYCILKVMRELPDHSIIFYADSGVVFTTRSIVPLIDHMKMHNMILIGHGKPVALQQHLKKEAYAAFDFPLTQDILEHQNIWAFFMVIKNTPYTREFIEKWLRVCENASALTDFPLDRGQQIPIFQSHLHDQSLLSVLVAKEPQGKLIIRKNILRIKYGVHNFHRHPDQKWTSPLLIMAGFPEWFSNFIWNNGFNTQLRKLLFR